LVLRFFWNFRTYNLEKKSYIFLYLDLHSLYFIDALNGPHTGLTYTALTEKRKESVPDCEKLFSPGVIQFMKDNGHRNEAAIVEIIHNWHKASDRDGRGLNEATRMAYNMAMLDWLLED
jgi:hypothetical protein